MYDPCDSCPYPIGSAACEGCRYNEDFWAWPVFKKEGEQ